MRKLLLVPALVAVLAGVLLGGAAPGPDNAQAVSDNDATYRLCARVFPDPHAYWPSPAQTPARSPFAKGNASCAATDFLSYAGMVSGLEYLEGLLPQFVEFYNLERDFGDGSDCATSTSLQDYCSAGLPRQGVPTPERVRSDLYMIRVTDERVSNKNKRFFVFPLAIHAIERAGAEAGVRAAEDLATWGFCEAVKTGQLPAKPVVDCAREGAIRTRSSRRSRARASPRVTRCDAPRSTSSSRTRTAGSAGTSTTASASTSATTATAST